MKAFILTPAELKIEEDDWNEANVLDAILLSGRMIRSDAGAPAGRDVIVAEFTDEEFPYLEDICAALALQRAMIAVLTCEKKKPDIMAIQKILERVESRGKTHDELLREEMVRAVKRCPVVIPPANIYKYKPGTVIGLLRRTLDAMNESAYGVEATGMANSLTDEGDIISKMDLRRYNETRESEGASEQPSHYPMDIRNNLSWIAHHPHADDEQVARYLAAYGTDINTLLERIEAYDNQL